MPFLAGGLFTRRHTHVQVAFESVEEGYLAVRLLDDGAAGVQVGTVIGYMVFCHATFAPGIS